MVWIFSKTLTDAADVQDEAQTEDKRLDQAEVALGDHVTGGVVQSWKQVQMRLGDVLSDGKHHTVFKVTLSSVSPFLRRLYKELRFPDSSSALIYIG